MKKNMSIFLNCAITAAIFIAMALCFTVVPSKTTTALAHEDHGIDAKDGFFCGTLDGVNYFYSDDSGEIWMTEEEYYALNPYVVEPLEFWEIDEFAVWMEEERAEYQKLVDQGTKSSFDSDATLRTWTQDDVDALYALWQEQLANMKQGYQYTKTIVTDDRAFLVGCFDPEISTNHEPDYGSACITLPDGTNIDFGNFETFDDAKKAVKKFLDE